MILAVINNKGGVGKTTSAVNLAAAWAHGGQRTLLVDLDSQCSASLHLGVRPGQASSTVGDLFAGKAVAPQATRVAGLDLVAGSPELATLDLDRPGARAEALRQGLGTLPRSYQRLVLDCPPALSRITINAVVAAEALLIPVTPSYLAVEGLVQFLQSLRQLTSHSARVLGILLTMVDSRMRLTGEVAQMLRKHYRELVLSTEIKVNVKLAEASSFGQSIFEYDPRCPGARLYKQVVEEVEARWQVPAAVA